MRSLIPALTLSVLLLGCGASPTPEGAQDGAPEPVLLVSQKGASSIAFYTLEGELLDETAVNQHPHEIVLSPDGKRLFTTDNGTMAIEIAGEGGHHVSIIDVEAREKIGEIDLGEYHRPHGIALCADGKLLVTSENPDQLLILDVEQKLISRHYDTGGETPHIVQCSPDSQTAYVSNARSRTVAFINLATGEKKLIETDDRPEGSVLSKDGSKLYVAHRDSDKVYALDTATGQILGSFATGDEPVRIGLTGDEKTAVYGMLGGRGVGIADLETMEQVAVLETEGLVSLEIAEDGVTATACAQDQDTCYVISVPERKILHTVMVNEGAGPDPALLLEM